METAEKLLIAYEVLLELGLSPAYAKVALGKEAKRFETEDPKHIAFEIYEGADPEWKAPRDDGGKAVYDRIRKDAQERNARARAQRGRTETVRQKLAGGDYSL